MKAVCKSIAYSAAIVFVGFSALVACCLWLEPVVKVLTGKGVVAEKSYVQMVLVSGRRLECPGFIVEKSRLPTHIASLHALNLGTNTTMVVVYVASLGHLYWFDGRTIGVTRYSFCDLRFFASRWMMISEIALNCTYNVCDDMKGLNAMTSYKEDAGFANYELKFSKDDKVYNIVVEIDKKRFETPVRLTDVD